MVVYWLLPPSEPRAASTDDSAQPAPAESESAPTLPMRSSPGWTPQNTKQISFICLFLQQKPTLYQGVAFDFAVIAAKSHVESRWRIIMEAFSHCPAVCILLANFIYTACLRWCTTGSVWAACCPCASPLSQVCLAWLLTSAVVCGRRPQRRELTGRCPASFVDKWGIRFQCGKDDGEGQEWLITTEWPRKPQGLMEETEIPHLWQ